MKKNSITKMVLSMILAWFVSTTVLAQEVVLDFYHKNDKYFNIRNIVETTDSCMIVECPMFEKTVDDSLTIDLGDMFYKVTLDGRLVDSMFMEIENVNLRTLLVRDPQDPDNYLYAYFDLTQDSVLLRMVYFDRDFNISSSREVLFDYTVNARFTYDYFMDPHGDIIASFSSMIDSIVVVSFNRIAFDGTLKYSREVPEIRNFSYLQSWHSWVYRQSPLQYSYWGSEIGSDLHDRPPIRCYVIDSLFNVTDEHCYYLYDDWPFRHGWQEHIIPLGEEHYLLSTRYSRYDHSNLTHHYYALLAKFDREHEMVASGLYGESTIFMMTPNPVCTATLGDTLVYYAFMTMREPDFSELSLLCFDGNLNLNWERHYTYQDGMYWGVPMCVLENGDVAIGSFRYGANPGSVSVVVVKNNGTTATPEMEPFVRPYTFYPNPIRDALCLRFSPDVQPAKFELYDLQGRLVCTQSNTFEAIDMSQLPTGTYMLRVTLEDGKVFSDKVIKK